MKSTTYKKRPKVVKPKIITPEIKFKLQHVVLYAKNWYHKSDNLIEDLKKCLTGDNYSGEFFTKNDVLRVIVNQFEKLPYNQDRGLIAILNETKPQNCWKYGYYTKQHPVNFNPNDLPEYDFDTACLYYILSVLRFMDSKEWIPCVPNFDKVLPRASHITDENLVVFNHLIQNA